MLIKLLNIKNGAQIFRLFTCLSKLSLNMLILNMFDIYLLIQSGGQQTATKLVLELTDFASESANSNADPPNIGMWVRAFKVL